MIGSNHICEKITLQIMGEPTIHPDFFEILEHAESVGVKVGLTTNGGGLGGSMGRRLLDYGLHQIDIYLQTPDSDSYALRNAGGRHLRIMWGYSAFLLLIYDQGEGNDIQVSLPEYEIP